MFNDQNYRNHTFERKSTGQLLHDPRELFMLYGLSKIDDKAVFQYLFMIHLIDLSINFYHIIRLMLFS